MAGVPRVAVSRTAEIESLTTKQEKLSEILATGNVSVQKEIELRAGMADFLILSYERHRYEQSLFDAITHLETILRRLPKDSPDLPKHFDTLSSTKMTEYTRINSQHALDQAILYGRKAKDAAAATGLLQRHPATYFQILTNLGFALAHRNALTENMEDLDEAIACGREICATASTDSDAYQMTLNNLASRLRIRYILRADPNDIDEAKRLVNELLECTTPGTIQHGMAMAQLGSITSERFKRTGMLRDLDEAIGHVKIGLEALPAGHETKVAYLQQIVELYDVRYRRMKDAADREEFVRYSTFLIEAIPPNHSGKGKYLLNHLKYLHAQVFVAYSGSAVQRTIDLVQAMLQAMPTDYAEKKQCQGVMANLFGGRYAVSGKIKDLDSFIRYVERISHEDNDTADKAGSSQPGVDTAWLLRLIESISQISQARADDGMRMLAEEELLETFRPFLRSGEGAIAALEQLNKGQGLRLKVLAKAIETGRTLSNDEITAEMTRMKDEDDSAQKQRRQTPSYRPPDYRTELGHRQLAIEPQTRNIARDLGGLMESILGYDPTQSLSPKEFAARETKMERESIEKARAGERHPNLNLCRMCRDFTKPLRPTTEGFELTAQKSVLPFGNFFQLDFRKNCSICRLVLSMISTKSGNIHPQLGAIDREIQGVRLSTGKLYTGEKLMRVDYGMRQVGEMRILARGNYRQALRQAWEARDMSTLSELLADPYGPINNRNGQQINPGLIKSWLNNCDHNHGSACNNPRSGKRVENDIPMTFINVNQQCLVTASSREKYFALSYIWGRVEMSKTLRDNRVRRHAPWALRGEHLPKTIKDAMTLVRNLGERFLWVDAICLVQDNPEQMARDIPNMDLVYGKAFATIVAMHGEDANAGLPGVAPGERAPQQIETITVSNKSFDLDHDPQCEKNESVSLVATPCPLHLALGASKWNKRGWILQERLLSRRCIYFSSDAVYFQCNKETLSEGGANEEFKACLLDSITLDDEHVLRNANHNNPLSVLNALYGLDQGDRRRKAFTAYNQLVETYSGRNLSFKSDILNAFGGVFAVLDEHFQGKTFYGLPAAVFSHALLWAPARRISRRGACLPATLSASKGEPDPEFPSWSWAGWDGPIEYRLFDEADGNPVLPTPIVRSYKIGSGSSSQIIEVEDYTPGPAGGQTTEVDFLDNKSSLGMSQDAPKTKREKVIAKMVPDVDRGSTWVIMPPSGQQAPVPVLEKNILRFTAPTAPVTAFQVTPRKEYISLQSLIHVQSEQAVRRIHDREGRHCGLWWEQAGYGYVGLGMSPEAESKIDMVGISYYGDAYKPRKGPNRVEGEIKIFDDEVFPAVGPGSGLVNVLVADMDMGHPDGIGDRCTVAVIHVKAWLAAHPQEKEVPLA